MAALDNPRHEAFCQAYTTGETVGNATQSYLSVYPDCTYGSAGALSCQLLKDVRVTARIAELQKAIGKAVIRREIQHRTVRQDELAKMYGRIVRSLEKKEAESGALDKDDAALLKEAREWMKQAAIEAGQWTEKQEHSGTVNLVDGTRQAQIAWVREQYPELFSQYLNALREAGRALPAAAEPAQNQD